MKKHYEVVCGIIHKDDLIFICQRGNTKLCANLWEFPGGKIEIGETKEQAIIREIKEELDGDITVNKYLGSIYHEYETFTLNLHAMDCTLHNDLILKEHVDSKWVSCKDLIDYQNKLDITFAEADIKILSLIEEPNK